MALRLRTRSAQIWICLFEDTKIHTFPPLNAQLFKGAENTLVCFEAISASDFLLFQRLLPFGANDLPVNHSHLPVFLKLADYFSTLRLCVGGCAQTYVQSTNLAFV